MARRTVSGQTDYEIVGYRPALKSQLFPLQKYLWGPGVAPDAWAEYLDWKYARNPYVDTVLIYLAVAADEVVGMRGLYGARWLMGQPTRQLVGLCAGDLVIAPEHRNRGIFRKLTTAALEDAGRRGYTHIFNLNPGLVTSLGLAAMGWRAVGSPEPMRRESGSRRIARRVRRGTAWGRALARRAWQYAKPLRVAREVKRFVSQMSAAPPRMRRRAFERLDAGGDTLSRLSGGRVRLSRAPEPEAMAGLVERIGTDGRIRHARDSEYFGWRFRNPLSRYRFLFLSDAGRLEGYLVLQTSILPERAETNILDWEASRESLRAELLRAAMEYGRFGDLRIWSATLPGDARALLRDAGFRPTEKKVGVRAAQRILVRPVRDDMREQDWVLEGRRLLEVADWDLRMTDSDAY